MGFNGLKKYNRLRFFPSENIERLAEEIRICVDKKYSSEIYEQSRSITLNKYREYAWSKNILKLYTEF